MMHGVPGTVLSSLALSKNQFQIAPMTCLYPGRKQNMFIVYLLSFIFYQKVISATF